MQSSFLLYRRVLALAFLLLPCFISVAQAAVGQPLAASQWQRPVAVYAFALYFSKAQGAAPDKLARELAASAPYGFQVVATLDAGVKPVQSVMLKTFAGNVAADYAPPTVASLKYFGRGLTLAQAEGLQKTPQVLVLVFKVPTRDAMPGLRKANALAHRLATETDALLWDEETREMFSPAAWKSLRLDTWEDQLPDVSRHITIHAYNDDDKVRAISLGMGKFALPDLVVNDMVWSLSNPLSNTINTVAQTLVQGARPSGSGVLEVQVAAIRHGALRSKIESAVANGGTGRGQVVLQQAAPQDGDPDNTLLELRFGGAAGDDTTTRQTAFVKRLFGAQEDKVVMRKRNDAALLAASERAKKKLPALRAAFQAGLQPGEIVMLKAPFATAQEGVEWMWVEVSQWSGEKITGMLRNEPRYVPSLKAGQMVEIKQSDVFDYIRRRADGQQEGNETSEILSKAPQ